MRSKLKYIFSMLAWACVLLAAYSLTAQAQSAAAAHTPPVAQKQNGGNNQSATGSATTSSTPGHLVRFLGTPGSGLLGDSIIFEDKFSKVGIGTITPTSPLTVQGLIETTLGGYKFPDGTVQTTALSAGQVVSSLNGLKGNIQLAAGANITITPSGNTLTIAAPNVLTRVAHDGTFTGDGSAATPLGTAVPFGLFGSVNRDSNQGVITAGNLLPGAATAVLGFGGHASGNISGGTGLTGVGGAANTTAQGGTGVLGVGGTAIDGVDGGNNGKDGGLGAFFLGGGAGTASGGAGAHIEGGRSIADGKRGGTGLEAFGGPGGAGAKAGLAAQLFGDVVVTGNLSKGGGSFKIDHPLDPENKYLYHSFVESPDMLNIYNGTVTTDINGDATVTLPDWFEALNQDFRYQLTVIGTFAQAIVAQKVKGNHFIVKTNAPNVEVSWQVTGIRHDAYANKHRIPVEEQKPEDERGLFLHPDAFSQPEDKGVQFVRNPRRSRD